MKKIILIVLTAIGLFSCTNNKNSYDASGTFETTETIVAAEANGIIKQLNIEEGQILKAGQRIGYIDSVAALAKKKTIRSPNKICAQQIAGYCCTNKFV